MRAWLLLGIACFTVWFADNSGITEDSTSPSAPPDTDVKVLIVGAGIAGLSAARALKQRGMTDFAVLEGSERVGGRIKHSILGGFPVEHGATWIHGGRGNPVLDLAHRFNVTVFQDDFTDYVCRNERGENVTDELDRAYEAFKDVLEKRDHKSAELLLLHQPDMDQRGFFQQAGWFPNTPEEFVVEVFEIDNEFAYPPSETSTKYPGENSYYDFADEDLFTLTPYSSIPEGLAQEIFLQNASTPRLFLDTVVSQIQQDDGQVIVVSKDGRRFTAHQVIVTVSLGVLQHKLIQFEPDIPDWKWDSINGFQFAQYLHFYLHFPFAFWDNNHYILYASRKRGRFAVWQNLNKIMPGCNVLQANAIQYEAERLLAMTDLEIQAEAMSVLRGVYGENVPQPISIVVPRFGTDPFFLGAYSNWPPGYTMDSFRALQAHVGRVHFAGEYADWRYYGYTQAALLSGEAAAHKVLARLDMNCENYEG